MVKESTATIERILLLSILNFLIETVSISLGLYSLVQEVKKTNKKTPANNDFILVFL
jgi:hypothetical protein